MRRAGGVFLVLGLAVLLGACLSQPGFEAAPEASREGGQGAGGVRDGAGLPPLPAPVRELRGLWVATAYGIDWPSKPGLAKEELCAEADRILDLAASLKLNAILLQVRPAGDALYRSAIEPWSAALTGVQGLPAPGDFDPLAYWISGARGRGLLLYAWINPFRAGLPGLEAHPSSPLVARPELVRKIGSGLAWLDPGLPEAREYVVSVALDLVRSYAPDGLVVDDYLYPYPSLLGPGEAFPDGEVYAAYRAGGGELSLAAWRIENGNRFMRSLAGGLRAAAPDLVLGASPFGIYRSGEPPETRGLSGREATGMDALAWAAEGLLDFVSPQLYWPSTALEQSFPLLLAWWKRALSAEGRPEGEAKRGGLSGASGGSAALWPSIAPAALRLDPGLRAHEALSELMISRAMLERRGILIYSARALLEEGNGIAGALAAAMRAPALPPELGGAGGGAREGPGPSLALGDAELGAGQLRLALDLGPSVRFLLLSSLRRGARGSLWRSEILPPRPEAKIPLGTADGELEALAFQVADARGRLSEPIYLEKRSWAGRAEAPPP